MSVVPPTTTWVVTLTALFPGTGSVSFAVTLALSVRVPAPEVTTRISTLASPALRIAPRLHVTVVVPEQLPWLGVTDCRVTPGGRTFVATTPVAVSGPLFVISRV